jgi:hypothetical protein
MIEGLEIVPGGWLLKCPIISSFVIGMLLGPLSADVIGSSSGTVKAGEVRRNFIAEIGGGY